jgi:DNA-binding NarL/FixJ family response regulator
MPRIRIIGNLDLSTAEYEALAEWAAGKSQKAIAPEARVCASCISQRITRAMKRNGFTSRADLLAHVREMSTS